ncbi:hypothetical protein ACFL6U_21115 [Planctomycetota bacterium]
MKTTRVVLMFVVLMGLSGFAGADDVYTWTGTVSNDWMATGNWDVATVPANGALGDDADVNLGSTMSLKWPVLDAGDVPPEIDDLWIGNGNGLSGELLVQGGVNLRCSDDIKMCLEAGSISAKLLIKGPGTTVASIKSLEIGEAGTAVVDIDGGKLEIGEVDKPKWNMLLGAGADSNVTITIRNGGLLEHHGDYAEDDRGGLIIGEGNVLIDIGSDSGTGGGTLKLKNNVTDLVRSLSRDGIIVADGGSRDTQIVFNDGYTYVTASLLTTRLDPIPDDGATVPDEPIQLQWTLPESTSPGGIITCDVWFGTNPEVETNSRVVVRKTIESVTVSLAPDTHYYWAIDLYDSSFSTTDPFYLGPIFTFNTMNMAPVVNAGDDIATWLADGPRMIQLNGVVSDEDGRPGPPTLTWTVIAEPNEFNPARISDPLAVNPTVAVSESGLYTLQLEASDGELTTVDTLDIVVYADACEHAANQAGFEWIPGDINHDCVVDERDQAIMLEHWLETNFSVE